MLLNHLRDNAFFYQYCYKIPCIILSAIYGNSSDFMLRIYLVQPTISEDRFEQIWQSN